MEEEFMLLLLLSSTVPPTVDIIDKNDSDINNTDLSPVPSLWFPAADRTQTVDVTREGWEDAEDLGWGGETVIGSPTLRISESQSTEIIDSTVKD